MLADLLLTCISYPLQFHSFEKNGCPTLRMRDLSGPMVMATPLAAVSRQPCGDAGPVTRDTEALVLARKRAPVVLSLRKTTWPGLPALKPPM